MQDYFRRRSAPHSIDYEEVYWDKIVDPDGNSRDRLGEREQYLADINQEIEYLNSLTPGRILDFGCGLGWLLSALSSDWEAHGIEASRFAAERACRWGKIHVGDLEEAGYPDEYFDVVVMHHVIEHLQDPVDTIVEIRRVLRRGGKLLLGTPDFDSACARRFGGNYRLLHDQTHISLFSNESMHRFLRDQGFIIDRVEYPYFNTRHFTPENLMRLFDLTRVSPPFYGSFMTFYCHRPNSGSIYDGLMSLSRLAAKAAESIEETIEVAAQLTADCLREGNKVLACGNGGSAADAQHFVAELVGRMCSERHSLPAIALSSDPSIVTALGNDYGFENVFSRQVEGLGKQGDVLIAISTSGRSPNILKAVQTATQRGLRTVALVGEGGDEALESCDVIVHIPSRDTQRVQELHTAVLHAICEHVEHVISQTSTY